MTPAGVLSVTGQGFAALWHDCQAVVRVAWCTAAVPTPLVCLCLGLYLRREGVGRTRCSARVSTGSASPSAEDNKPFTTGNA